MKLAVTHATSPFNPLAGGTPLYKLYRYVPPHRVAFLRRFGLKTGIHFAHFGLESGMVFGGTVGVYEGGVFIVLIRNELERRRNCFLQIFFA